MQAASNVYYPNDHAGGSTGRCHESPYASLDLALAGTARVALDDDAAPETQSALMKADCCISSLAVGMNTNGPTTILSDNDPPLVVHVRKAETSISMIIVVWEWQLGRTRAAKKVRKR